MNEIVTRNGTRMPKNKSHLRVSLDPNVTEMEKMVVAQ
jgi:hypothetical protein